LIAFLIVVLAGSQPLKGLFSVRPMVVTGIASYSIYLVHLPVIGYLERHGVASWPASAIALGFGFAFWRLVERPFLRPEVRGAIERALEGAFDRLRLPRPQLPQAVPPAAP
jgi:peptidoglycan/LPS O-acetylase OafA/YrhL